MKTAVQILLLVLSGLMCVHKPISANEIKGIFEVDSLRMEMTFEEDTYTTHEYKWHVGLSYKYRFHHIAGNIYEVDIRFLSYGNHGMTVHASPDYNYIRKIDVWYWNSPNRSPIPYDFSASDSIRCSVKISGRFEKHENFYQDSKFEHFGNFVYSDTVWAPVVFDQE